jgi:hypothetical protein
VSPTPTSCVTTALTGSHATYNVGPGQTYPSLTAVPFLTLQPGDVVNIFYQSAPYATKFALQSQGTAAAPIIINGVTDASCHQPVITGNGAVTAADAIQSGFFTTSAGAAVEDIGLITFLWGPTEAYATLPSYITLQNITVTGAQAANTFVNHAGVTQSWSSAGAIGIYAVIASHVTIQNCVVTGNDEGVFFNSQDAARTSYYITLRGNVIYGNGLAHDELNHNIYVQAYRALYEGNYIGEVIPNSPGSSLKDRSSGTVIRNNYIASSARAIDLVDTQDSSVLLADPLYNYAWVYGNVIVDDFSTPSHSSDLIHWGGDSYGDQATSSNYRNGTLYFYFNTVIVENDPAYERDGIFDMPSSLQTVEARSNIFWFSNNSANTTVGLGLCCGTINFDDTNWISNGWVPSAETGNSYVTVTLIFNAMGTLLQGTSPGLNADFTLSAGSGSPVIGRGVLAPTSVPSNAAVSVNLQPTAEYANKAAIVTRPNTGDLGAYAAH